VMKIAADFLDLEPEQVIQLFREIGGDTPPGIDRPSKI
jgi:hypothetical protein